VELVSLVAGIDYSVHAIDVVMVDEDTGDARWHRRRLDAAPGDAFTRARRIRDLMPARRSWLDTVVAVGIERPYSQNRGSVASLLRIQGAILACLPVELDVVELPPQTWKTLTVGKAKASKVDVRDWVVDELFARTPELSDWPQDAFDAYAIARATIAYYELEAAA
jgi:Holliday junction resolvasome RuvABC endonuclease subunit